MGRLNHTKIGVTPTELFPDAAQHFGIKSQGSFKVDLLPVLSYRHVRNLSPAEFGPAERGPKSWIWRIGAPNERGRAVG
jgi:hypothetical protein